MREGFDEIVRQEWRPQSTHPPAVTTRAGPAIITTAASVSKAAPRITLADADRLFEERETAYAAAIQEGVEADEDFAGLLSFDEGAPWLAACLLAEVDKAVVGVLGKMRVELGCLRRALDRTEASLTAARRKHVQDRAAWRSQLRDLEGKLADQEKAHAEERQQFLDELRTLSAELAEQRAVAELRHSRAGRSHSAKVELRLLRKQLEAEAKGAA